MIKGWTEALQLMKAGSKYQLFVPADLAYGERGAGSDIGPNATLLFDVELLEVVPAGIHSDAETGDVIARAGPAAVSRAACGSDSAQADASPSPAKP